MAFRNFIYTKDDDDLAFLPNEPSPRFGIGSPSASVNTKPPKDVEEPEVQPAEVTADLGESPKADVFIVHPGSVVVRIKERKCKTRGGSLRPPVKRRLASGSLSSYVMCAKTSASKDDALFLSISDDDEGKFLVIEKMSGEADVIKARERSHEEECERLRVKCEAAMVVFYQNPAVLALREKISSLIADVNSLEADKARLEGVEASLHREVEELKQDRRDASNDFATATFPWLDEFVADATSPIETLLSKKPPMLQKPASSRTQMYVPSSHKATPSSAPSLNPMSSPADLVKPSPSLLELRLPSWC
ncbi:hypothetical protein Tco_1398388 [Tanacetum coccineum]